MRLPEDILTILEDFWAREYESDYRRFIELEEHQKVRQLLDRKMAGVSTI